MSEFDKYKIAIIQDALVVSGGAERVAAAFLKTFPEADFYTSVYLPNNTFSSFRSKKIITLPGSSLISNEHLFKIFIPLWILGFFLLDLSKYDVVITSSTYAAKFIRKKENRLHICYLHAPFRYLWKRQTYTESSLPFNRFFLNILDFCLPLFRKIDKRITQNIDHLITNSTNMSQFINEVYSKESTVIFPPIVFNHYFSAPKKDYYLIVSRLVSYKRIDIAIEACKKLGKNLIIVGDGPELMNLRAISNESIKLIGNVEDSCLRLLYAEAKGLIFPGCEDFGIVPIEAQASGCPVIAFRGGGALETIIDGKTGLFFDNQTVDSLSEVIQKFEDLDFNSTVIREHAKQFDITSFMRSINRIIKLYLSEKC